MYAWMPLFVSIPVLISYSLLSYYTHMVILLSFKNVQNGGSVKSGGTGSMSDSRVNEVYSDGLDFFFTPLFSTLITFY